ncbi:MAG TPA: type II toxin-antitoxin system PemK/MazF family toxin [Solirubrobacteraceae bacterium]|nr:type II toxin-antitoxin system PemK/MazF family toxin [Solirubrobacteraceae bacterium]
MSVPEQGDIWWAGTEDKRRPVLVITRSQALPVLKRVVVAPVTRTVRGIPTEIALGRGEGLDSDCAASFDNLQTIMQASLTERAGTLGSRRHEICETLRTLADC